MADSTNFDNLPTLEGPTLLLRPLLGSEFESLHAAAADPAIWEQHPEPTRHLREVFATFFRQGVEHGALAVVDRATGSVVGSSRYYNADLAEGEVSIGFTFLARSHWGGAANLEMKTLMLDHAFGSFRRVWLHIGLENHRSRKAARKIGAIHSHDGPVTIYGATRESAWYRIDSSTWNAPTKNVTLPRSP